MLPIHGPVSSGQPPVGEVMCYYSICKHHPYRLVWCPRPLTASRRTEPGRCPEWSSAMSDERGEAVAEPAGKVRFSTESAVDLPCVGDRVCVHAMPRAARPSSVRSCREEASCAASIRARPSISEGNRSPRSFLRREAGERRSVRALRQIGEEADERMSSQDAKAALRGCLLGLRSLVQREGATGGLSTRVFSALLGKPAVAPVSLSTCDSIMSTAPCPRQPRSPRPSSTSPPRRRRAVPRACG